MSKEKTNMDQPINSKTTKIDETTTNNLISIQFTPEELQVLVGLLDVAVRARGLDVAGNAVVIHQKIRQAASR